MVIDENETVYWKEALPLNGENQNCLKIKVGWKTKSTGSQSEIFQGRGGFVKLGHSDEISSKNPEKKPQGKVLRFFFS